MKIEGSRPQERDETMSGNNGKEKKLLHHSSNRCEGYGHLFAFLLYMMQTLSRPTRTPRGRPVSAHAFAAVVPPSRLPILLYSVRFFCLSAAVRHVTRQQDQRTETCHLCLSLSFSLSSDVKALPCCHFLSSLVLGTNVSKKCPLPPLLVP